ncbi:MAG: hypothetical protein QNL92_09485 [Octadecabacter sp.]
MISELCISDLDGHVTGVLAHAGHIEAPNWHRDGYLVVNGGGRLFRVDLDAPELVLIDTGAAADCNNDHGISPCGTRLVVSDQAQTEGSCIYTLPVTGGAPVRVTQNVPSYWHGWSPDGATLAYVGRRDAGPFRLYVIAVGGGAESCLTEAFDHVDGPDYTPDGQWIWFNGERDGAVDLWRIPAKGGAPERMTDDTAANWFPHPSPCGEHVVYLAYPEGTKGHPAGLDVALRVMPAAGGASRKLIELHGGQGSINVPSWAPDGRAFAFVRYVS